MAKLIASGGGIYYHPTSGGTYVYSPPTGVYSVYGGVTTKSIDVLSDTILKYIEDFGPKTKSEILAANIIDSSKVEESLKLLFSKKLLFKQKDDRFCLWPSNVCKKCNSEIKTRELFLSKWVGCLC